jgi:hypothetical protein
MLSAQKTKPTYQENTDRLTKNKAALELSDLSHLDLRKFMDEGQELNNPHCHHPFELAENISYSLGLLAYAMGLFSIAYWVLVNPVIWFLGLGIIMIGVGLSLFLNPLALHHFFKKNAVDERKDSTRHI